MVVHLTQKTPITQKSFILHKDKDKINAGKQRKIKYTPSKDHLIAVLMKHSIKQIRLQL